MAVKRDKLLWTKVKSIVANSYNTKVAMAQRNQVAKNDDRAKKDRKTGEITKYKSLKQ